MIEQRRPCKHCGHVHVFVTREDDRETCPRCSGDLYPITTVVTDVEAAAERIERSLLDGEAIACWTRIDDISGGEVPVVKDIAARLAECAFTLPMERVLHWARTFAREQRAHAPSCAEARKYLEDAAIALEYGCRSCGSQLVVLDESQICRNCAVPVFDPEAEFDDRCRAALAAFKEDPKRFHEAAREIMQERPELTLVEFAVRADRAATLRRSTP